MRPILAQLEHRDVAASQTLRAALSKVESSHPGFSYDLVLGLVRKGDVKVNLNESLLRLQGTVTEQDNAEYKSSRTEEPFQELNKKSLALKKILSRIPDEITDRKTFLETIKLANASELVSLFHYFCRPKSQTIFCFQGNCERDKEAVGRGERGLGLHPGQLRQAGPRAAEARVRQVFEALLQHAQGVLQRGTAQLGVRLGDVLDLPNQPAHDHGQEQVRVRGGEDRNSKE